jgi:hypothetical protein
MTKTGASSLLLATLLVAGCQNQSSGISSQIVDPRSAGVLFGSVTKGPMSPVVHPGEAETGVAGAQIDVATTGGNLLRSIQTDSKGDFRVDLPAGTYEISMRSLYGTMFTRDLPASITITPGREHRLDIHLDTGIR